MPYLKHGMSNTPIYQAWANMRSRCNNPNHPLYQYYGKRGITICQRWETFSSFYSDMGSTYQSGLTLERIDNEQGYSPNNCRWASWGDQARNRRNTYLVTIGSETRSLIEWSEYYGISYKTVKDRLTDGWNAIEAIVTPPQSITRSAAQLELDGESHTVSEWAQLRGVKLSTLKWRLRNGWPLRNALSSASLHPFRGNQHTP